MEGGDTPSDSPDDRSRPWYQRAQQIETNQDRTWGEDRETNRTLRRWQIRANSRQPVEQENTHDIEALRRTHDEARTVLDQLIQIVNDNDTKGIQTVRLALLFLGVLISGVSIAAQTSSMGIEEVIAQFQYLDLATFALIGSLVAGLISSRYPSLNVGPSADDINLLLNERHTEADWLILLLQSYEEWIRENAKVNWYSSILLVISQILLIASVVLMSISLIL